MEDNVPQYHCKNRKLEWCLSSTLFTMALWTLLFPGAFSQGRFAPIDNLISTPVLGFILFCCGGMRMVALYTNGQWPFLGSIVRMVGALGGVAVFAQMGLALWVSHLTTGADPSPGIVVYSSLTAWEGVSAYRAAKDARIRP